MMQPRNHSNQSFNRLTLCTSGGPVGPLIMSTTQFTGNAAMHSSLAKCNHNEKVLGCCEGYYVEFGAEANAEFNGQLVKEEELLKDIHEVEMQMKQRKHMGNKDNHEGSKRGGHV